MKQHISYFEFCRAVRGYEFYNRHGYQVYRFELYWSGVTPAKCFEKFTVKEIEKQITY